MKLFANALNAHLSKNLEPIYIVHGDEVLLVRECVELIRAQAVKNGFDERQYFADNSADWGKILYSATQSLSLFTPKRIIEISLTTAKFNKANCLLLQEYAANPDKNTVLILSLGKIDSKMEAAVWFKSLEKLCVIVTVPVIYKEQLSNWILQRAKNLKLTFTPDAARFLADMVEGNLLAAAQELEKISLMSLEGQIDKETLMQSATDNAHFDIFDLVSASLENNPARSLRILQNLKAEGVEPTLILWALTREIRLLSEIKNEVGQGQTLASLFSKHRIWEKRQGPIRQFLQHHSIESCLQMIRFIAQLDRLIKGAEKGDFWTTVQQLVLIISNNAIIPLELPMHAGH